MPVEIKVVKAKDQTAWSYRSARSQYDWDTILDGQYRHVSGYECKDETFAMQAKNQGRKRNKVVRTRKHASGGIELQAFDATPEQIAKWQAADEARKAEVES